MVQDPNEAEHPDMPLSILNNMEVDYCVSLSEMAPLLDTVTKNIPPEATVPDDLMIESEISERVVVDYESVKKIGDKSNYACPGCGGGLWHMTAEEGKKKYVSRYRCHIGHSYPESGLV